MFNSAFTNTAMSTLIATLVATTLSTVPAVAGEGGNMDRMIKYYSDDIEHQEDEEALPVGKQNYAFPYNLDYELSTTSIVDSQRDDSAYSVGSGYTLVPSFSARFDR